MIFVDELTTSWPIGPRIFRTGFCHLTTDGPIEELHDFARRLQLKRGWFQDSRVPHYDLTPRRRQQALAAGAAFLPAKEQVRRRRMNQVVEAPA